jgi:hypothetical protein
MVLILLCNAIPGSAGGGFFGFGSDDLEHVFQFILYSLFTQNIVDATWSNSSGADSFFGPWEMGCGDVE